MPPFSRGGSHLLRRLQTRASSSKPPTNKPPSPTSKLPSKLLPKRPLNSRPTTLESRRTARAKPSAEKPVAEKKVSSFDPLYGFTVLRISLSQSLASFLRQVHKQHARLPQPIRYTINFIYLLGVAFALIVPPVIVFRNHFYDIIRVTGPSMSPYLNTDFEDGATSVHDITRSTDRILLKLYRPRYDLRRGMVVAFRTPHDPERWAIKRIVALQGDRVYPLAHYPGLEALCGKGLIVPFGHMWVEGDVSDSNKKDSSMDSNIYGPVSTGLVLGKALNVNTSLFGRWIPIDSDHFKLPGRVQIDAVTLQDPDEEHQSQQFEAIFQNGKAIEILEALKRGLREEEGVQRCKENPELLDLFHIIRTQAKRQTYKRDSQTAEVATSLLEVVDDLLAD
ncbi:hypothetical protein EPUS_02582 [Endocarpon pusillum Z07020]|uniref:Mitochondrial inner membrane protease subunit 2 n=1 Tax=Endocarpon pusillum (strain Z07020 / HMAS-L-300199) TaxID=1263415 RepID=U1GXL1_ENDPU|nr:uncharacterized protein EPUS_02582 [Endocarpon pusillum Z07020]ERF76871.1 hypothetical protein EPUS_02582 [Endocarpon pusillum Z07020]